MMMVQYLLDADADVVIPGVAAPQVGVLRRRRARRARARAGAAGDRADQRARLDRARPRATSRASSSSSGSSRSRSRRSRRCPTCCGWSSAPRTTRWRSRTTSRASTAAARRRRPDRAAPGRRMTQELRTVRVAAIQATPRILDAQASVEKAVRLIGEAAGRGAELAVLPETFVPLYPSNRWAHDAARFAGWDELWERLWENAVDVPGPLVDELVAACARHGVHAAIGVNERERERPGIALQHAAAARPGRPAAPAPQADADPARAALPRHRRGRRPAGGRDAGRAGSAG